MSSPGSAADRFVAVVAAVGAAKTPPPKKGADKNASTGKLQTTSSNRPRKVTPNSIINGKRRDQPANRSDERRRKHYAYPPMSTPVPEHHHPPKTVYLIRHGQSLGQCATSRRQRETDRTLLDCGLSCRGRDEARSLPEVLGDAAYESVELILTSPLTRAVETSMLAFPDADRFPNLVCHYDLREVGSMIPENIPRKVGCVLKDIAAAGDADTARLRNFDYESLQPPDWPRRHDATPKVLRGDRIRAVFGEWLARRPENVVAVVCHYHTIRAALRDPWDPSSSKAGSVEPRNAQPIRCELGADGMLRVQEVEDDSSAASAQVAQQRQIMLAAGSEVVPMDTS